MTVREWATGSRKHELTPKKAPKKKELSPPDVLDETEEEIAFRKAAATKRALLREEVLKRCREDFTMFAEYVGRGEEDDLPIVLTDKQCEWVAALEEYKRIVLWGHPESGRSTILAVLYVLWRLGRNPNLRVAIVGYAAEQPMKSLAAIKAYIEKSQALHEVFPHLAPGGRWTTTRITIKRPRFSRDPSVQVMGATGTITGARLDLLICDDMLDYENVRNEQQRDTAMQRFRKRFLSRLTKTALVAFFANAWHRDDIAHRLERDGWWARRYPVMDEDGNSTDPIRWPLSRIEEVRTKILVDPAEFNRSMMCIPRDDTTARFKESWINYAYERGSDVACVPFLDEIPPGCAVIHAVDLAVSKKTSAARSVIVSGLVYPNGDRQLLAVRRGRWTGPEIVSNIVDVDRRYGGIMIVENVATQEYILQFADQEAPIALVPFTTGRNKLDPRFGVESLAVEMERGRWIFPIWTMGPGEQPVRVRDQGLVALAAALLDYEPGEHTADEIMAMWIMREGARRFAPAHMADRQDRRPKLGATTFVSSKQQAGHAMLPVRQVRSRLVPAFVEDGTN